MENQNEPLEAITDIRRMMLVSTKFISLSGLSGVFAGIYALIGAYFGNELVSDFMHFRPLLGIWESTYRNTIILGLSICSVVLMLSILTAILLSARKAKKNKTKLFDHTSKRLLISMFVPLFAGGVFCISLLYQGSYFMVFICPAMLIFYGLSLVSGSKHTLHDLNFLGYLEIGLGLISCFYLGYGLLFWSIGFGMLHIVYGTFMWFKYDYKK